MFHENQEGQGIENEWPDRICSDDHCRNVVNHGRREIYKEKK